MAAKRPILKSGDKLLATINNSDKDEFLILAKEMNLLGCQIVATEGTAKMLQIEGIDAKIVNKIGEGKPDIVDSIRNKSINMIVNTPTRGNDSQRDGFKLRRTAVESGVSLMTSLDTLRAMVTVMKRGLKVKDLDIFDLGK